MNTKIFYNSPYSQVQKDKLSRFLAQNDKQMLFNKLPNPVGQQKYKKEFSPSQEGLKHLQSNRFIVLNNNQKSDIENYQSSDQRIERQLARVKNYYQNQIKNIINLNKKTQQQLEAKCRGLQKQRNQWKQFSMKLKNQLQAKIQTKQTTGKQTLSVKQFHQNYVQQENNSAKANKSQQEEVSISKTLNSQMNSQINKLRQQNSEMRHHLTRLQGYIKSLQQRGKSKSPMNSKRQRNTSPAHLQNRNQLSPRRHQSMFHHKSHKQLPANSNGDPSRQMQKVRKYCGKLEKALQERNEEIMRQKIKLLNMKYMKM